MHSSIRSADFHRIERCYTSSQHYAYNLNILLLCIGPNYLSLLQQPLIEFTPHFKLMRFVFVFLHYCRNSVRKVTGHFRDHSNVIIFQLRGYVIFNKKLHLIVLWLMTPYSLLGGYERFAFRAEME
jgi:hypothetical protein